MNGETNKNIVCKGKVLDLKSPLIMGIINATVDSFYEQSRATNSDHVKSVAIAAINNGASILDVGGYSTRPGADFVSEEEEIKRIRIAINAIREVSLDIPISVDTFRTNVARIAIEECGADIINDVSAGEWDKEMLSMVAKLQVPYVLVHSRGNPQTMQNMTDYTNFIPDLLKFFAEKISHLRGLGFNKEIIIDLGFGFAKTSAQNYEMLNHLDIFECFESPILVGVSRETMIWKNLGITPSGALNGTTALNCFAMERGANILRVHDITECNEAIKLYNLLTEK